MLSKPQNTLESQEEIIKPTFAILNFWPEAQSFTLIDRNALQVYSDKQQLFVISRSYFPVGAYAEVSPNRA